MDEALPGFERITGNPDKLAGRPCIRGHRFTVEQMLQHLAGGWTTDEIIAEYPFLEPHDVLEALRYAATLARDETHLPLAVSR